VYVHFVEKFTIYIYYIKIHGMESFTIVDAQEARSVSNYKNTKYKLLKTSAALWHNKTCVNRQLTPKCVNIRIKGDI